MADTDLSKHLVFDIYNSDTTRANDETARLVDLGANPTSVTVNWRGFVAGRDQWPDAISIPSVTDVKLYWDAGSGYSAEELDQLEIPSNIEHLTIDGLTNRGTRMSPANLTVPKSNTLKTLTIYGGAAYYGVFIPDGLTGDLVQDLPDKTVQMLETCPELTRVPLVMHPSTRYTGKDEGMGVTVWSVYAPESVYAPNSVYAPKSASEVPEYTVLRADLFKGNEKVYDTYCHSVVDTNASTMESLARYLHKQYPGGARNLHLPAEEWRNWEGLKDWDVVDPAEESGDGGESTDWTIVNASQQ